MTPPSPLPADPAIERDAALAVLRHDRGMTPAEQDAHSQWLAADPRHRAAFARHLWAWEEFDRLAGLNAAVPAHAQADPDLLAARRRRRVGGRLLAWTGGGALAAAAVLALAFLLRRPAASRAAPEPGDSASQIVDAPAGACAEAALPDGSVVQLNRGAEFAYHFTAGARRVRLIRGEAHFQVAKNPARPFIVSAASVDVRAVGTAFDVQLDPHSVEVTVDEGHVRVAEPARRDQAAAEVGPGQAVAIALQAGAPAARVQNLLPAALAARLAWRPVLLDFNDAALADIVAEFNRRNAPRLVIADPALADFRLSASFRSDNEAGFLRLLQSQFGVEVDRPDDREIVLRRAR